eukprot:CAMPEP_0175342178 /NCGR_PEP_ID=MMETSP0095-20121207/6716_2 /TAXON_ID=311494 /ORGANISM="Alexandrium monilatum, Strain CCMP3105" /LENGTH=33 /DNA_ID= /DNA_START= /DNA_END= /DNA_ORIENTATION=
MPLESHAIEDGHKVAPIQRPLQVLDHVGGDALP